MNAFLFLLSRYELFRTFLVWRMIQWFLPIFGLWRYRSVELPLRDGVWNTAGRGPWIQRQGQEQALPPAIRQQRAQRVGYQNCFLIAGVKLQMILSLLEAMCTEIIRFHFPWRTPKDFLHVRIADRNLPESGFRILNLPVEKQKRKILLEIVHISPGCGGVRKLIYMLWFCQSVESGFIFR